MKGYGRFKNHKKIEKMFTNCVFYRTQEKHYFAKFTSETDYKFFKVIKENDATALQRFIEKENINVKKHLHCTAYWFRCCVLWRLETAFFPFIEAIDMGCSEECLGVLIENGVRPDLWSSPIPEKERFEFLTKLFTRENLGLEREILLLLYCLQKTVFIFI